MYHGTYHASNLSYSEQFSTKFNQIWDTFIKTRYYFSIFTLKYGKICIIIRIKYRDTYLIVDHERYTALLRTYQLFGKKAIFYPKWCQPLKQIISHKSVHWYQCIILWKMLGGEFHVHDKEKLLCLKPIFGQKMLYFLKRKCHKQIFVCG